MRRVSLFLTSLFLLNLLIIPANSAVKYGDKCAKAGQTATASGKKFTCIKSGKKLIWNKGVAIPKPVATPTATPVASPTPTPSISPSKLTENFVFNNPCQDDPLTPPQWREMSQYFGNLKSCQGIYRIVNITLSNDSPKTEITPNSKLASNQICKIQNIGQNSRMQAFPNSWQMQWWPKSAFPAPKMVVQVIPIYGTDTPYKNTKPIDDYGKYFDFFKEWIEYISDVDSNVEIRVPEKYLNFNGAIGPYGVTHEKNHTENERFSADLIRKIDSEINFSGVNMTWVVVPPGTSFETFFQGSLGEINTQEGSTGRIGALPPETFTPGSTFKHLGLIQPNWMVHEFFHVGVGLDDRYGNSNFFNNVNAGNFEDSGLGGLTLMSTSRSDLSAWEKWILGFISDSQVRCISEPSTSIHWITPSTYKTTKEKLLVIKIDETKAIAIESIRGGGLNYKLNPRSYGAFVYLIDTTLNEHGRGMKGLYPSSRKPQIKRFVDVFYDDAPLKVGDSLVYGNYKISVVEAGDFGDVVKVEKL